jgi:hypothetical protein
LITIAETLGGWSEPEDLDLSQLTEWEKRYMLSLPNKGRKRKRMCRLETGQWLTFRLVGKQFGASDKQVTVIADAYFAKHR